MNIQSSYLKQGIGLELINYQLPEKKFSLNKLSEQNLIQSPIKLLRDFGFRNCYIARKSKTIEFQLALNSANQILRNDSLKEKQIIYIFLYSGISGNQKQTQIHNHLNLFRYPASQVGYQLGLTHVPALKISQQGCSGLLSTLNIAHNILSVTHQQNAAILCLPSDSLPIGSSREIMYNIISDAGGAVLISKSALNNKMIYYHQTINNSYFDTPGQEQQLLASYFPMAQRNISQTLERAKVKLSEISWIIPHNVSLRSWQILASLLDFPMKKIWTDNISRVGHTISCDHLINLKDMENQKIIKPRDKLLLFTFGFGASWTSLIIEH